MQIFREKKNSTSNLYPDKVCHILICVVSLKYQTKRYCNYSFYFFTLGRNFFHPHTLLIAKSIFALPLKENHCTLLYLSKMTG